jgi:diguanylate cyclase (GGDEF)-like protein/PAS domain S-box-containing protein
MATAIPEDTRSARARTSRSALLAVFAGGNLIAGPAIVGIWLLRRSDLLAGPPYWAYILLIGASAAIDIGGRLWLARRPDSEFRKQTRVALAAGVATVILYTSGLGSALTIGYALCAIQMLAQIPGIDWRRVLAWCLASAIVGELAIQFLGAPHVMNLGRSHVVAVIGLVILSALLWVVGGIFASRDAVEEEARDRGRRLAVEAATDPLTKLLNRAAFTEALERSCAAGTPAILAFVDLDNFKDINDSFGHHVGDEVLVEVAARLRRVVRMEDVIARFGGDEFVILVNSSRDEADASRLVERIWAVLAKPWPNIAPNTISASVGVVDDRDGTRSPDDLLREADKAMYSHKHGMSATGTMSTMTSRALSHHRLAMDGIKATFVVLHAIRHDGEVVDFEVLEANTVLRDEIEKATEQIVGSRTSNLEKFSDQGPLTPLYKQALQTGATVDTEVHILRGDGRSGWSKVNVVPVDRDIVAVVATDITAEVEAREAMERERARFGGLIDGSSDLACIVDHSGEVMYAPPSGTDFLGFSDGTLGAPLSRVAPNDRAEAATWFDDVRTRPFGSEARSVALRFIASDGTVRTCEVTAHNRFDEPAIGGIVLNAHDVSDLVAAEARLAAVADAVGDIITIFDAQARIMWVSGAVRNALGLEPDDLVGVSAFDLVHADDHAAVAERLTMFLGGTDATTPMELRLRRSDGTYDWFETSGRNQFDDPSIRGIVVSMRNITQRRATETALRASEQRNRSIVEAAADAIVTVDTSGIIQGFNRAAELIFATSASQAIGEYYGLFLPEDSLSSVRTALASGRVGQQIDTIATRASGERFAAQVAISEVAVGDTLYFTAVVRDISDQRAMEQALRIAATCDELTGLPNRRTLLDRAQSAIEDARRTDDVVGMVFVDLDRFKLVNDGLGHDAGDALLRLVAERIAGAIRVQDVVARLGSDEFVVLCPNASDLDAIKTVALRIVDALAAAFPISGNEVFIGASIGVSVSTGVETPLELLRFADTAMYRAKEGGYSRVEVFDTHMQRHAARRLDVESALRQATGRGELLAYYQPIVELESGRVSNLEALIRWDRRGVGLIRPDNFIPIAEEARIILEIGAWMLRMATTDCVQWQAVAPGVGVSVNVSVRQFESGDLVEVLQDALACSGLAPGLLTLEITESVMLDHSDRNAAIMRRIRDLGMHISLDDFGSGYSSLTYLRLLPIDSIKIDRSFLQSLGSEMRDRAMLRAIVNLGMAHDLAVVAEGIDSEAKLSAVREVGCHFGQGFLFSKPVPFGQTLELLERESDLTPVRGASD